MKDVFSFKNPAAGQVGGDGVLNGARVALQPNIAVTGWPAEAGSKALGGFKALEDAAVVKRLRASGACLCGATRMSEFGFGLDGSMAGKALRSDAADAEIVLDMLGESRMAGTGRYALKPSYGIISRIGVTGLMPSMEVPGLLSHDMGLLRKLLQVLVGPDDQDYSLADAVMPSFKAQNIDPAQTGIGIVKEALEGLDGKQAVAFKAGVDELTQLGFCAQELSLPDYRQFVAAHQVIGAVEASSCAGRYDSVRYGRREPGARNWNEMYLAARGAAFGPLVKSLLFEGAYLQFERYSAYEAACRLRARLVAEMDRLAAQVDFLVMPLWGQAVVADKVQLAQTYAAFGRTLFANVTGQPVLCLPPAAGTRQAPVQLVARRRGDGRLIDLGEFVCARRGTGGSHGI